MHPILIAPAKYTLLFIPTLVFLVLIPLVEIAVFAYIMALRLAPLVNMKDAIKVAGLERKMEAFDLSKLVLQHMA